MNVRLSKEFIFQKNFNDEILFEKIKSDFQTKYKREKSK
jgi:hypothetical protein